MKNKKLKKGLMIGGFSLLGILVLLLVLPLCFQNKIAQRVLKESDRFLNAKVTMENFHLSLFRTFPNPTLVLKGVTVENVGQFKGVTLLKVDDFMASVNLFSIFSDTYKIKKVIINNPKVNLITTAKGSNWDIMKNDDEKKDDGESHFNLKFDKIVLNNANISYKDVPGNMSAKVKDLDFSLSGNLSSDFTTLQTAFTTPSVDFKYNGIKYLSSAKLKLKAAIDADFNKKKYTVKDNEISINALVFSLQGWVTMLKNGMDMDLKLNLPKNDFKNIISLIPAIYAKNFEDIKTSGKVALTAFAKGKMVGDTYPSFDANLKISDAMFRYPSLPASVDKINIDAEVKSPGGSLDKMVADIRQFHFVIINNPFDLTAHVATPISDPDVAATLKGILDLSQIKKVYPLEATQKMSGIFNMDVSLAGRLSYLEKKQYNKFKASGVMSVKDLLMQNVDLFDQDVAVSTAKLQFTSAYADLQNLNAKVGKNDFSIKGKVENYIPYIFSNGTLKGSLTANSNRLNINELFASDEEADNTTSDTTSQSLFKVPANLDMTAKMNVKNLQYDDVKMQNAVLLCSIRDAKLHVQQLSADLFSGSIKADGAYSNPDYNQGLADVTSLSVSNISARQLCESFHLFDKFLPVFKTAAGNISMTMKANSFLDETMAIDYQTMSAEGTLGLLDIQFMNSGTLKMINEALKLANVKAVPIKGAQVKYKVKDGKMITQPFSFKMSQGKVDVETGSIGLDKSLNYTAVVTMPSSVMGTETVNLAKSLAQKAKLKGFDASSLDEVKFAVKIGGTLNKPTVSVGLDQARSTMKEAVAGVVDDAKMQVKEKVDEAKAKAIEEAQKKADELIAAAQQKADELVEAQRKAGEKLIEAARTEAQKSIDAAKNPLEKAAKQTAANLAIAEAEKKAAQLNAETQKKANKLVDNARAEGNKLIDAARR